MTSTEENISGLAPLPSLTSYLLLAGVERPVATIVERLRPHAADIRSSWRALLRDKLKLNASEVRTLAGLKIESQYKGLRTGETAAYVLWLEEQGPFSPALLRHIRRRESDYDYFIFFSYRYYHSYHGIKTVPRKAILVPTAERDEVVSLAIFRELFRLPRAVVYNSIEERAMIWSASGNRGVPGDVVGVGSELPATADGDVFRRKFEVSRPYMLYVGRVDPNKGCRTLFHYFRRYREETASALDLLLVGGKQMEVPAEPGVRYLGFLSEQDKWGALAGAELLVMPSELESLSMVTLEAWGMGKPVLANGKCEVLRGQCRRSNAGLYFDDYYEFREALSLLEQSPELRAGLGANGRRFYHQNYRWEVVEGKYNRILETLSRDDRALPPAPKPGFFARLFS